jgi:hypothetical protein
LKTYAKIRLHDKANVVAQLPDPRGTDTAADVG